MGRSVSVPHEADVVTYIDISNIEDDYQFEDVLTDIIYTLKDKMPSLQETDKWVNREDRAILENEFVYIGVSGYGNIMSLWIVPKGNYISLTYNWIDKIAHHVTKLGDLTKQGTMSNGVSVYNRKVQE